MGRQVALLQPILGLVTAAKGHHQLGHEALGSSSNDDFLSGVGVAVKGCVVVFPSKVLFRQLEIIKGLFSFP